MGNTARELGRPKKARDGQASSKGRAARNGSANRGRGVGDSAASESGVISQGHSSIDREEVRQRHGDSDGRIVEALAVKDWPDRLIEVKRMRVGDVLPHAGNPRRHPKKQLDPLKGLLSEVGKADVLRAYYSERNGGKLTFWDGHARRDLDNDQEWPIAIFDIDDATADKLILSFDPLSALAEYDKQALDALLHDVTTGDAALQEMLSDLAKESGLTYGAQEPATAPEPDIDHAAELQKKWKVKTGDVWQVGRHRLMCGDSTRTADMMRLVGATRFDCVFTSLPYGVGVDYGTYEDTIENLRALLAMLPSQWAELVVPGGFAVVNFGDIVSGRTAAGSDEVCEYPMATEYWPPFRAANWVLWSRRIWCKPNARVPAPWCASSNRAASDWEHVWTWKRPGQPVVMRQKGSQMGWFDSTREDGVDVGKDTHGAGMAVTVALRMIHCHSRDAAPILEPFLGTGTTTCAAEQTGRTCYGMEIEPKYVAVTLERLHQMGLNPMPADRVKQQTYIVHSSVVPANA